MNWTRVTAPLVLLLGLAAPSAALAAGGPGVYLSGAPHEVLFETATGQVRTDRVRLAGNVLVWQQGQLTIRIEGTRTLAQALALARSLR